MMRKLAVVGVLIVFAGCDAEPSATNAAPSNDASRNVNEIAEAPAQSPVPATPSKADDVAGAAGTAIPTALHGRWGLTPGDCTSTRGDAKGLLTISGKELRFYESRGTIRKIVESDSDSIAAEFDFSGEGQTWQRRMMLAAQDNGRTLTRTESGADAMAGSLRYTKCEAL